MWKDFIAAVNHRFQRMVTVRYDQIYLFRGIFGPVQIEQISLVGRIVEAISVHVFDKILKLKIRTLVKCRPHSLFGKNVPRQAHLASD